MIYNLRSQQVTNVVKCCKSAQGFFCEFLTDNGSVHEPENVAE